MQSSMDDGDKLNNVVISNERPTGDEKMRFRQCKLINSETVDYRGIWWVTWQLKSLAWTFMNDSSEIDYEMLTV